MTYGPMRAMRTPCRLAAPDVARAGRTARGERRGGERGWGGRHTVINEEKLNIADILVL